MFYYQLSVGSIGSLADNSSRGNWENRFVMVVIAWPFNVDTGVKMGRNPYPGLTH